MTTEPCRLSFIVITMNRPGDLRVCLASLLRQTCPASEIIVVDNHSTDDTREVVAREFPTVRLVVLAENRGVSGGRNAGVMAARGEVCFFIDDDAWLVDPEAGAKALRYFDDSPDLGCLALTIRESATGREERKSIPRRDKRSIAEDYETTYFCGAGFAFRKAPYVELGMFWEPLMYGSQEIDLSYRLLNHRLRVVHTSTIDVIHKSSPTARPSGQWVYFNTRDRPWVAARHLPWRAVVTTTVLWWGNTFLVALKTGQLLRFWKGLRDCLVGFAGVCQTRSVVEPHTVRELTRLSGRYWY